MTDVTYNTLPSAYMQSITMTGNLNENAVLVYSTDKAIKK